MKLKEGRLKRIIKEQLDNKLRGWFGYAQHANTYKFRQEIISKINNFIVG